MPRSNMMSNSAVRNGGATLFLTTLARVRLPTASSPSLMRADAADVDADGAVELQGVAAGRGLGVAEHHADLLADLVDEDDARCGSWRCAPVSLRRAWLIRRAWRPTCVSPISPSISALGTRAATESITITSTALERTSSSQISRACSPVSGWLISSCSRFDAELAGPGGVQGVLGVDERGHAAGLLGVGDDVQGQRGLAGALRAEELADPPAGHALAAQGQVQAQRPGGDAGHRDHLVSART